MAVAQLGAAQIQALVILNHPAYEPERWHITLVIIAFITVCMAFNTIFYRQLPLIENLALVLHIIGFFAILIPLWAKGTPSPDAHAVFFTFTDGGGWGNVGLSTIVGILSPMFSFLGPDSATHMAEELRNASKSLPRAMIATMLINGAMGFVMLVTFCMFVGNDLGDILSTPTGQPFIQVFYNATGSKAGTTAMTAIMTVIVACGVINNIATSSRQLWAFARDKGVPFSEWFGIVNERWDLPVNALVSSYVFSVLLSLINIGSAVALNVFVGLGVGALVSSYAISIGCMAVKRLRGERLLTSHFRLGWWGMPLNVFGCLFFVFCFVMVSDDKLSVKTKVGSKLTG